MTAKVGESMAKANEAMAAIGKTNDPAKIAQTMQQFQKENAKMEMGQEMMDDSLDGIWDDDETETETNDLMNQVCICSSLLFTCSMFCQVCVQMFCPHFGCADHLSSV